MEFYVPPFPEIGQHIELPNIAELLMQPMWGKISAEDLRKHGTELQKYILDKAPLKNDRKHVVIFVYTNFLYPGVMSVPNMYVVGKGEWHRDGSYDLFRKDPDRCHLLLSDCEAITEFNVNELNLTFPDGSNEKDITLAINENPDKYGIIGKKIEPNRFATFENHLHRVTEATHKQFRYMFRIIESNNYKTLQFPDCSRFQSTVSVATGQPRNAILNIEINEERNKTIIHSK